MTRLILAVILSNIVAMVALGIAIDGRRYPVGETQLRIEALENEIANLDQLVRALAAQSGLREPVVPAEPTR